jgi:ANTAR domain
MAVVSTPLTDLLSVTVRPPVASCSADLSGLMRRLTPASEPAAVFKSLTRVLVPLVCDASSVWIRSAGQQPSHISFGVAGSDGYPCSPGPQDARTATSNSADLNGALLGEDTVVIPISPVIAEGQLPYRGVLTMSFHGVRPTMTHVLVGHLLVERAISLVQREQLVAKANNLYRALDSNRDIGAAMGILMARHQLTSDQAFDLLRRTSQRVHRKIVSIAADVIETGELDLPAGVELLEPLPAPRPPRRSQHLRLAR